MNRPSMDGGREAGDKTRALTVFRKYPALTGDAISPEERREVGSLIAESKR